MSSQKPPRRQYIGHNGEKLPGVTSVLQLLNKPALLGWAAKIAAEETASAILDGGIHRDGAIEIGRKAHLKKRDKAADLGTRAHDLVEHHYKVAAPIVDVSTSDGARVHGSYSRVVDHFFRTKTIVAASEVAIVDKDLGFGGTIDFVLVRDGKRFIGDLKTGKAAHDEVIIQLAAYRWLWSKDCPDEPIDGGGILIHSPLDGVCTEVAISSEQLDVGQHIFGALIEIHKHLPKCKLGKPETNDEGAIP